MSKQGFQQARPRNGTELASQAVELYTSTCRTLEKQNQTTVLSRPIFFCPDDAAMSATDVRKDFWKGRASDENKFHNKQIDGNCNKPKSLQQSASGNHNRANLEGAKYNIIPAREREK